MTYNPMSLQGKTILVTGASSGIGRAIAIECSKLGASCILTARNESRLQETLDAMEGEGHSSISAELTDSGAIQTLVSELPKLDGVSHNAGIGARMLCGFAKTDTIERLMRANLTGIIELQTMLLKKRKINKGASLVFMSSISVNRSDLGNAFYGITKSGLYVYSKYLANELKAKGIRANAVCPAMIETPLINNEKNLVAGEDYRERDMARYIHNRYGKPEEVAHMVAYLLSDAAEWITGGQFSVDGGALLS